MENVKKAVSAVLDQNGVKHAKKQKSIADANYRRLPNLRAHEADSIMSKKAPHKKKREEMVGRAMMNKENVRNSTLQGNDATSSRRNFTRG